MRTLPWLALVLVGCNGNVRIDPEGYRCDEGNSCPTGFSCRDGVCHAVTVTADPCAEVSCNSPPASTCLNPNTARSFSGQCVLGQCQYNPVDTTCAASCEQGSCLDACMGMACVTPPATACIDTNTLRTFSQTGTCTSGHCDYQRNDVSCPNGCENGGCKGADLCAANHVACDVPPAPVCVGNSRRTFTAPGSCQPSTGACTFASSDLPCANGCALGQCLTASLSFSQTGPRVRFAVNGIDVAPGSAGSSALVVGNGGKLARWDGANWVELPTPATRNLNRVAFVSGTLAYIVGAQTTAWTWRSTTNQMLDVNLRSSSPVNLLAVSGRSESEVLIASSAGDWWRMLGGTWSSGSLTPPFDASSAYLDESGRERIAGSCGTPASGCVWYRHPTGGTPFFLMHEDLSVERFTAVGGTFEVPNGLASEALTGADDTSLETHNTIGLYNAVSTSPALKGAGIAGITAQATGLGRDIFVLTSSRDAGTASPSAGGLYRLSNGLLNVSANLLHETRFGEEVLSPNDATGVLVAEVRRQEGINNIFRIGSSSTEALDLGEDFVGASIDGSGALVLANRRGDVAVRRQSASTFALRRPVGTWVIQGMEARNGTGTLLVGRDASNAGLIVRSSGVAGFTTLGSAANATFNAVCRVSDNEGWAVGSGGVIYQVKSTGAVAVLSPTTKELLSVDCSAGVGVAVGADSTVLRLNAGNWVKVSNFPMSGRALTAIRLSGRDAFVVGDGLFYKFSTTTDSWTALPTKTGLSSLVIASPQEIYGSVTTNNSSSEIFRFDGASWNSRLIQVSGVLGGGVQAGSVVVWGGTLGVIVEAR